VTLARNISLPDDGLRTETCRSVFNVLMCKIYKLYIYAVVGVIIERLLLAQQIQCSTTSTFPAKHFLYEKFPRFSEPVRSYFGKYPNRP